MVAYKYITLGHPDDTYINTKVIVLFYDSIIIIIYIYIYIYIKIVMVAYKYITNYLIPSLELLLLERFS